jgi:hypothetical protein
MMKCSAKCHTGISMTRMSLDQYHCHTNVTFDNFKNLSACLMLWTEYKINVLIFILSVDWIQVQVLINVTNQQTKWSRVLLENLIVPQLVKFPAFNETQRFICVSTRTYTVSMSSSRLIHPTPSSPIYLRSVLTVSICAEVSQVVAFHHTKTLHAFLFSPMNA